MEMLRAVEMLSARAPHQREAFDVDARLYGADCWAEVATAAAMLSGMLDDATTDAELDEALAYFQTLHSCGVLSTEQLRETTNEVIAVLLAECEEQERATAYQLN